MSFERLFGTGKVGNMELRNRIVMSPMAPGFCTKEGFADERMKKYFEARAKGGAGLICMGASPVEPTYFSSDEHFAIFSDGAIPGLYEVVNAVHVHGAKFVLMLGHRGRQWDDRRVQPVAPSSIACRSFMYGDREVPRELTTGEVEELVEKFAEAARRVQDAGADGVVLQGHGYLIHEFMSPYTNARTDKYGGNLERRITFAVEIIESIREKCGPDFPVGVRMGQDYLVPGNTLEEVKTIAKILESKGVAWFSASGGMHEATREKLYGGTTSAMGIPPGWELQDAEAIKSAVSVPVFAVGGLGVDLELAERVLEEGKADFIEMGRGLMADPDLPIKVMTGRVDEINWCIRCGECHPHDRDNLRQPIFRCTVNAFAGREADVEWRITPAAKPKKVLVIGGGPGGMEAARVAALRGHDVTLYEKNDKLGGQLILAARPPGKVEVERTIRYLSHEIERLGVKVEFGVEVTPELVEKVKPDVVILATGSTPIIPKITGAEDENVVTVRDVLTGKAKIGEKVVVLGGGGVGAEVASYLAEKGKKVTIIEILPPEELEKDRGRGSPTRLQKELLPDLWGIATDLPRRYRMLVIKRLGQYGVKTIFSADTEEITDEGVTIKVADSKQLIETNTVVLAIGDKPNRELYQKLFAKFPELYIIGDCVKSRRAMEAISEGAYIALRI